ncbi:hypothetical protein [Luteimonas sp. SDU101]|uniref:hypothetical protein n=1 Tax=Luteimonas sp. SDU101 TaxID=3422593 RepID=UPI003EBA1E33
MTFVTLGEGLEEHALAFAARLRATGAIVRAEVNDGSMPRTPTLQGTSGATRHYADIVNSIKLSNVEQWVSYCKCRPSETFYSLVVPDSRSAIKPNVLARLRELGVGVYVSNGSTLVEVVAPHDLSMSLSLPALAGEKRALQRALAGVYAKFDRGEWFDGFKDACQLLESKARKRLEDRVRNGSVSFSKSGQPRLYSVAQIRRKTLGQLAVCYSEIVLPTARDQNVLRALRELNPDRIGAVHKTDDRRIKARLRGKVGVHMWMLVNGLRELV